VWLNSSIGGTRTKSSRESFAHVARENVGTLIVIVQAFTQYTYDLGRSVLQNSLKGNGCLLASRVPLYRSCLCGSVCPAALYHHLWARTRSRISLFRLQERIDR
jgi:hypothetical protein